MQGDAIVTETLPDGARAARRVPVADVAPLLHHGGTKPTGEPVWLRGADGREWHVAAGSDTHALLIEQGATECAAPDGAA